MSLLYYLRCIPCRKSVAIGQRNHSDEKNPVNIWFKEKEDMENMGILFQEHEGHNLEFMNEYKEIGMELISEGKAS